jgi:phosphoribosylformimino-5-aminoimidazole carboxamide ribotide isomerase
MLTIYPAIDLKDGTCVRLRQGEMAHATVYAADPAAQAKSFERQGAAWLHVVDLNGAVAGRTINHYAINAILLAVSLPVQLGGGLRDLVSIERWLEAGIRRVILGSVAVTNPDLVHEAASRFPGRIAVGIDARDGLVATEGWTKTSTVPALDIARRCEQSGVGAIIYTDIARDGMSSGVNVDATLELARRVSVPVIASGGIGSIEHLRALRDADRDGVLGGVIVGRALYDGSLSLAEALAAVVRPGG